MTPEPTPRHEIRIATVMYGGTSLAVYMNGIAQEMLQLVRATSPHALPGQATSGTAIVYRKLAHLLEEQLDSGTVPLPSTLKAERIATLPAVRFVVDILSGSSAGGINAVMLAKALARNADLNPIRDLWLDEAGIDTLINDRKSAKPRYPYREPVQALFSSDRMYTELHQALRQLRPPTGNEGAAPLVERLDLAVTATDLDGEAVKMRLADKVVDEFDHRQSFDFVLGEGQDMFTEAFDDRLAFAARTTSSLPAVFEPSTVAEARRLATNAGEDDEAFTRRWQGLFRGKTAEERRANMGHAFADGGYLDNKPFGHAIDKLAGRSSASRVTRKLYYIEPLPRDIDPLRRQQAAPDALANTMAVVSLARYEPIRQDVQRLSERNRTIDRLRTLHFGVSEDLARPSSRRGLRQAIQKSSLREAVEGQAYGAAYGAYHRLRVAVTTDRLAGLVGDVLGVADDSDERQALRGVISAWRNARYRRSPVQPQPGDPLRPAQQSEGAFLDAFDLSFPQRRARFLLGKINQLAWLDETSLPELRHVAQRYAGSELARLVELADEDLGRAQRRWRELEPVMSHARRAAQQALDALADAAGQAMAGFEPRQAAALATGGRGSMDLLGILRQPNAQARKRATDSFLQANQEVIEALLDHVATAFAAQLQMAETAMDALRTPPAGADVFPRTMARVLRGYLDDFPAYDLVQFPVLDTSGIGEELAPVQIHRIGTTDADFALSAKEGVGKLYGARFATFGAFFDRRWRESDVLWGRLDGADRLISTLLPPDTDPAVREALLTEAYQAILAEAFAGEPALAELQQACRRSEGDPKAVKATLRRFLLARQEGMDLDLPATARSTARLLRASGKLFDGLVTRNGLPGPLRQVFAWLVMLGSNLAEVAVPRSLSSLLVGHALNLVLLVSVAVVAIGWWQGQGAMVRAGGVGLFVVVGLKVLITGLQIALDRAGGGGAGLRPGWLRLASVLAGALGALVLLARLTGPLLPADGTWVDDPRTLLGLDLAFVAVYTAALLPLGRALLRHGRWVGAVAIGLTVTATVHGVTAAVQHFGRLPGSTTDWLGSPAWLEQLALHLAILAGAFAFLPHRDSSAAGIRLGHLLFLVALVAGGVGLISLGSAPDTASSAWSASAWKPAALWWSSAALLGAMLWRSGQTSARSRAHQNPAADNS